jgi:aminoglycoside phosphotransferase (APT) family kinase protein
MKQPVKVTPAIATLILERHFRKKPKVLQRIHGGLANHVFETSIGRENFVLRISEHAAKLQAFMKEQWAVTAARKIDVPTPEILEVCNDVTGLPYMILRKVNGTTGSTVGAERMDVLHELGEYTSRINAIKTKDFGHIFDWSPNKLSRNRTWKEYLGNELKVNERISILEQSGLLTSAQLKTLRSRVLEMSRWKATPNLSHGDIRLKNVIVNERHKIVAILDWENCTSNIAPYWELSLALHDLTMDEKQKFVEGYGLNLGDYMRLAPSIKTLNVLNYARSVRHALKRNDKTRLLSLHTRLSGAFDLCSL